jgi:hypothetical protein
MIRALANQLQGKETSLVSCEHNRKPRGVWPTFVSFQGAHDALLSPLLDPLEGQTMLSCEKLGLEGRSRLPALKEGRGAC